MKKSILFFPLLIAFCIPAGYAQNLTGDTPPAVSDHSVYQSEALWTNQRDEVFKLRDLKGKPAIVTMFYGNCLQVCPILIRDANRVFEAVDESFRDQVQVLAITFDPENDTPGTLRAYAEQRNLNIPQWHFMTGTPSAIREVAMLLGVQYRKDSHGHFSHSNLVAILDDEGEIVLKLEGLNQPVEEAAAGITELLKNYHSKN